jgi:hypothetical protein
LNGVGDVVVERRAVIDEVADGEIAEQDLPTANDVEEVIVGEPGERAAGVIEPIEPREQKHQHRKDADESRTRARPPAQEDAKVVHAIQRTPAGVPVEMEVRQDT